MPIPPGAKVYQEGSDRALYDHYRDLGLNPDVAKQHVELRRSTRAQGTTAPDSVGAPMAAALGAYQGATSGFGDELAGQLSNDPAGMTAAARQTLSTARMQHPLASLSGEVAGSFVNPALLLANKAIAGLRLAKPAARGVLLGAAAGGLQGLGESNGSLKERAPYGAYGAAGGAALGYGMGRLGGLFERLPKIAPKAAAALEETPISQVPTPKTVDPLEVATAIRRGTLEPSTAGTRGYRPAGPKTSKPGKPIWYGSGSPTKSAAVRGGERLLPDPRPGALLRQTSFQTLQATLREPSTPQIVKDAILQEIQRRGIVGEGLLPPLQR